MAIWRRVACSISKATRTQAHTIAGAPAPTHARKHTRAFAEANTEICKPYCFFKATVVS
jgi:hypothetical protein